MSRHNPRVPGTAASRTYAVPVCSVHRKPTVRGARGEYVCPECLEGHVKDMARTTGGGVELPHGVRDERIPSFRDMLPNRRVRRQLLRGA